MQNALPKRHDGRIIIHFDYDCFYAAVFEREDPKLKTLPFAVQQKQIIVTCNYEARRRGLHKLQLIREARKACPDVIIALGEDLTRFRNASKDNYEFLRRYSWSNKVERLGFDEVFMDVTDLVDYNLELLNRQHLSLSFFHLDRNDPTAGFPYEPMTISGHTFPMAASPSQVSFIDAPDDAENLSLRLRLGSHLAMYLRHRLEQQKGYSSTVGIGTNKLLSKLVGNVNKPKGQTTLVPPYNPGLDGVSHVNLFVDAHDIGNLPGIGFKIAQKIRSHALGRPANFDTGLVYGGTREAVTVKDIRSIAGMGVKVLQGILLGPGVPRDLPDKVWGLINGVDDAEVIKAKEVPHQISIEDSYIRLDEISDVIKELRMLSISLLKRMRLDLTSFVEEDEEARVENYSVNDADKGISRRWIAQPKSIRLSTRPRPPLNLDGTRPRTFTRISKSGTVPSFTFNLTSDVNVLATRLVDEALLPLFRKLHPERGGWNLSLVNVCVTNMSMNASDDKVASGRDIGRMFRRQEETLKHWKVDDIDIPPDSAISSEQFLHGTDFQEPYTPIASSPLGIKSSGSEDVLPQTQSSLNEAGDWDSGEDERESGDSCKVCGATMPAFAMTAHERFHDLAS